MSKIKLSLIENSNNFLNESLAQAIIAEEKPEYWKYAILHLVQAIELTLKERLRVEHHSLIYKNIDKPKETVSLKLAADRLQKTANVELKKRDLSSIQLASKIRNQIVHYSFSFDIVKIKTIYANLIGFIQDFSIQQHRKNLSQVIHPHIWDEAIEIIDYVRELKRRAEERFSEQNINSDFLLECKVCRQMTFVFQNDINTCYVCGFEDDVIQCMGCDKYLLYDDAEFYDRYWSDEIYCPKCMEYLSK